ncbi:hypothetical protein [endosymbiont GvMRE of Glomus versiforme]|uniref:hypothetical protein n=1 Tax=endosymbiont GvMRE of Glomus versiforme TaxID=2039283 RepID=UPI000ED21C13|nr:hypothetical protein [endosymbiont GvMRE of Glomus versiforme]RHZ36983.1 hypothetical protein GvMRE_I2g481 [endosymbiont GvMRE of Glomus versiforme]
MKKYLSISPYSKECLELGVCFYDREQENYHFFTWGEVNVENIISLVNEKIKEYEVEKVIFSQPKNSTKIVKESFASLASIVDFQAVSKEIIQETSSLLNKGIYSIANLERKSGFWYVKEQRILTNHILMAYLALVRYLEKERGQKLIQENETLQPLEKKKQPSTVFTGQVVKCEVYHAARGVNKGNTFYSLLIEHDDKKIPRPVRIAVFYTLLRDKTIWEKLISGECLNKNCIFYCWSSGKGLSLSFWEEENKEH